MPPNWSYTANITPAPTALRRSATRTFARQHHPDADGVATLTTIEKADLMMVVTIRQHHPGAHGVATP